MVRLAMNLVALTALPRIPGSKLSKAAPLALGIVSIVAVAIAVAAQANAESFTFYPDRASFLAAAGSSITDDYTAYGVVPGVAPLQLSDAEMSAVLVKAEAPELALVHRWLDNWQGVGLLTVGAASHRLRSRLTPVR